ncbi:glycosyltransferase family protein [Chelatococcus reniformis]|uniref:glycosyltransferase family protein n=1 Tax=Chelatococcus reniformis TaxID=1494448 RepID=UPI001FCEB308|nr:glycosyltransferase [Chelatococcus reniformis]
MDATSLARVLIYSHDTFGLGHLRRSRAIANALVAGQPDVSVIIISGSPVIGNFEFRSGVDYVRIPGVVKLANGDYRTLNLGMGIDEAAALRGDIIRQTVESFRPDMVIIDKEPTGFRGEVMGALDRAKARGARIVLGIRDIMDEPSRLVPEWERKGAVEALKAYYDDIWVYGLKDIYEPLAAFDLPRHILDRITYTGYLRRGLPRDPELNPHPKITKRPFILVTSGGGGDGEDMLDWVISAYEADPRLSVPALIVFGPFMARERCKAFMERIARHPCLEALSFDSKLETLMNKATAVVAMGGYNTFCEVLSFNKPALIVPRCKPRLEQYIRAVAAERLGLVSMIVEQGGRRDPLRMAEALLRLPNQRRPGDAIVPGLLDGTDAVRRDFARWLDHRQPPIARSHAAE